ncbi:tetratricopeptide repeat protein [Paraglaciecola sp. 25GB23A]|uniref:tetratricopeptide repeat protein n=1 Tax=Paraglaciecola sp. 25GB23A TaxID=3156068 RepID=UPI0032AE8AE2
MSVVNKMLQDLEARQASDTSVSADYQAPQRRVHWWWILSLCLLVVLAGAYWLLNSSGSLLKSSQPISADTAEQNVGQETQAPSKPMLVAASGSQLEQVQSAEQNTSLNVPTQRIGDKQANTILVSDVNQANDFEETLPSALGLPAETQLVAVAAPPAPKVAAIDPVSAPSVFSMQSSSQANQTASLRANIKDALANNNDALAITLLSTLLEQEPNNLSLLKKLASLLFANNQRQRATTLLQSSIQQNSRRGDLRLMLARLYVQQQQSPSAWTLLNEIEPEQHIEIDYWAYRANLAQQLGHYLLAKRDYIALTQAQAYQARWWLGLGITQEKLGAQSLAKEAYQKALSLAQFDAPVSDFIEQRLQILVGRP